MLAKAFDRTDNAALLYKILDRGFNTQLVKVFC